MKELLYAEALFWNLVQSKIQPLLIEQDFRKPRSKELKDLTAIFTQEEHKARAHRRRADAIKELILEKADSDCFEIGPVRFYKTYDSTLKPKWKVAWNGESYVRKDAILREKDFDFEGKV